MGVITTSLVINFDAGESGGLLKAEIDTRESGYNSGVTQFAPGDAPVFLLFSSSNVSISSIESSYGSVSQIGSGSMDIEDFITFAGARDGTPSYPISSGFSGTWVGRSGGPYSHTETKILLQQKATAVLRAKYKSAFKAYRLSGVPTTLGGSTSFPIVVYITGGAT